MLIHFFKNVDPILEFIFYDNSLTDHEWFIALEKILEQRKPKQFSNIKSYDLVVHYVRFKYMEYLD